MSFGGSLNAAGTSLTLTGVSDGATILVWPQTNSGNATAFSVSDDVQGSYAARGNIYGTSGDTNTQAFILTGAKANSHLITVGATGDTIFGLVAAWWTGYGDVDNALAAIHGAPVTSSTSTLTLPAATTAYTAGQLIANSATAGSVVVPSFAIANTAGGAIIPRLRLSTNDATATGWGAQTIQVDLWSVAPTFTNGDRAAWLPATGSASHLAAYTCTMAGTTAAVWGDGIAGECSVSPGNATTIKLASGTSVFWTLDAISGSGVTGVSKVFTLTAELLN